MTRQRLYMFNLSENSLCELCKVEESAIHLFYFCRKSRPIYDWLLRKIQTSCDFKPDSNIRFLYFDFNCKELHVKNICILLLCSYITTIWSCRSVNNLSPEIIKKTA